MTGGCCQSATLMWSHTRARHPQRATPSPPAAGSLRIEELLDFLDIARTALSERLFDLYREGSDGISASALRLGCCRRRWMGLVRQSQPEAPLAISA